MSEPADAAPAAAPEASQPAPSAEPVASGAPSSAPVERAAEDTPKTLRGSIDKAFASLEKEGDTPAEAGVDSRGRKHGPDGKFVASEAQPEVKADTPKQEQPKAPETPKDQQHFADAPNRFSADAKAAWKDAPLPIRAEVHRLMRENEAGIQKYREDAQSFEPLKPYAELAKQNGTDIKRTLDQYLNFSRGLNSPDSMVKMRTIEHLVGIAGMSLRDLAASVMGQKPEEATSALESRNRQLEQRIAQLEGRLEKEVGEVRTTFQQQREAEQVKFVEDFAKSHPRFEELAEEIAAQVKLGYDLAQAYDRAERLHPAPVAQAAASDAAQTPASAAEQPKPSKGVLQVAGAPGSGSDPAYRKPSKSTKESIDRAFAQVGLG